MAWFTFSNNPRPRRAQTKRKAHVRLEVLENRCVPAAHSLPQDVLLTNTLTAAGDESAEVAACIDRVPSGIDLSVASPAGFVCEHLLPWQFERPIDLERVKPCGEVLDDGRLGRSARGALEAAPR